MFFIQLIFSYLLFVRLQFLMKNQLNIFVYHYLKIFYVDSDKIKYILTTEYRIVNNDDVSW